MLYGSSAESWGRSDEQLDDILIAGRDLDADIKLLDEVLGEFEAAGIALNIGKCVFLVSRITFFELLYLL